MTEIQAKERRARARAELLEFHADLDRRAAALTAQHGERIHCGLGCADCCHDDLGVFEVEADRIERNHPELLREESPHPPGACAFLDADRSCRIYADRPYICRNQGLPLRWFDTTEAGAIAEYRDICPLNLEGPRLEDLDDDACWLLGPDEGRLRDLALAYSGDPPRRVQLRKLFEKPR